MISVQCLKALPVAGLLRKKTGPDGTPWADWSPAYAETRGSHHGLLQGEGDLLDDLQNLSTSSEARIRSGLVYSAIHQFGGDTGRGEIPARPYLGLSEEDEREITALVYGEYGEVLQ